MNALPEPVSRDIEQVVTLSGRNMPVLSILADIHPPSAHPTRINNDNITHRFDFYEVQSDVEESTGGKPVIVTIEPPAEAATKEARIVASAKLPTSRFSKDQVASYEPQMVAEVNLTDRKDWQMKAGLEVAIGGITLGIMTGMARVERHDTAKTAAELGICEEFDELDFSKRGVARLDLGNGEYLRIKLVKGGSEQVTIEHVAPGKLPILAHASVSFIKKHKTASSLVATSVVGAITAGAVHHKHKSK